ncbi:unnamed protein product [Hymenolepis diminuta]|uniref:Uncharacterized protein n=1 Tax=Hymenolepis diminuta TaxID=6216 RepID=A0A564YEU7_HYMDI|nr:unnamed protein product [Hymenolepis diminuta]
MESSNAELRYITLAYARELKPSPCGTCFLFNQRKVELKNRVGTDKNAGISLLMLGLLDNC